MDDYFGNLKKQDDTKAFKQELESLKSELHI